MSSSHAVLRFLRSLHLYIGVFISPMLLFFALTGAMQTFGLNDASPDGSYKPPTWISTLAQLHKKQTTILPQRKPKPADSKPADTKPEVAKAPTPAPAPAPPQKTHMPMKIFFLLVALGLFTSTSTGIYMAYKFNRSKLLVTGLLVAGVVVPLVLLKF
jgi:hypothetical protein